MTSVFRRWYWKSLCFYFEGILLKDFLWVQLLVHTKTKHWPIFPVFFSAEGIRKYKSKLVKLLNLYTVYQPVKRSVYFIWEKKKSLSFRHVKHTFVTEWKEELACEDWGLFQLTGTRTLFTVDPEEVEEVLRVTSVVLLLTSWPAARCSSS